MTPIEKRHYKKWEVSIMEIHQEGKVLFKVTRRLAEMSVAETNVFENKEEAKQQFEEWLK
jgi:hypothetical protein